MSENPKISVVMPAYNHEPYVKQAIDSILNQSYSDFELIIIDDKSTDNTLDVIRQIQDPRIQLYPFETNKGACFAVNFGIEKSRSNIIALTSSDDFWQPDKLSKQIKLLEQKPDVAAVFTEAQMVDEHSEPLVLNEDSTPKNLFNYENRSRGMWLRKFFLEDNCLCHPSIMMRKECHQLIGLYDNTYRQSHDFDLWIKLVKKYNIYIINEKLINYRVLPTGQNTSSQQKPENWIRTMNERYLIAADFFNDITKDIFKEGFSDILIRADFEGDDEFEIEKCLIYFKAPQHMKNVYHLIGLTKLHKLLNSHKTATLLNDEYKINDITYHHMLAEFQLFRYEPAEYYIEKLTSLASIIENNKMIIDSLKSDLNNLYSSNSWKMTAWLRKLSHLKKSRA